MDKNKKYKNNSLWSRYFISVESIEEDDKLGEKYNVDILITRNLDFDKYIAIVLHDEEIIK